MPGPTGADKPPQQFIFFDPRGSRWPRFRRFAVWAGIVGGIALVLFLSSVWIRPAVRSSQPPVEMKGRLRAAPDEPAPVDLKAQSKAWEAFRKATPAPDSIGPDSDTWQRYMAQSRAAQDRLARLRSQLADTPKQQREIRVGFYVDWDANSVVSLHEHANELTHLVPEWFSLVGPDSRLVSEPDPALSSFCAAHGLKVIPLLRNLSGDIWQPEAVENLARAGLARQREFARDLVQKLKTFGAGGVMLDFSQIDPALQTRYTGLFGVLQDALHQASMELWLAVSMDDELNTYDFDALGDVVDRFVAMLCDEHTEGDPPGPPASQEWFEGWLQVVAEMTAPEQWIAVIGANAYDWNRTRNEVESISFRDAMSRASYAGVENAGGISVVKPSYNGRYVYSEPDGEHEVWFLDAISFYNQLRAVRKTKIGGLGIYRLGTGDPQIWQVLGLGKKEADNAFIAQLSSLRTDRGVTHVGRGEIVSVDLNRDDGTRQITREPDGKLRAIYIDAPTYPALYHQGAEDKTKVAITFDDGPDPVWTPKILDVLKARGVKAAFFIVGRNAEEHPELVRRIVREGHELGNHTYTHGNLAEMPEWRMRLEIDGTERLVESLVGRALTLFRPPYNADATPSDIAELAPLAYAEHELGYTIVLERIDPQDWARPGADVILQRIKEQRREGNIILLHDAGGDRSQTLAALPRILDWLAERGDRVVPLSDLLNIPHEDLMPWVGTDAQTGWRTVAMGGFHTWRWLVEFLWSFMIVATGLVVVRSLLIAWLAWRNRSETERETAAPTYFAPPVSVLIAAYNEGKVIAKTLLSVIDSHHTGELEVVVVDDGSKDDTAAEVERIAAEHPQVRLIRQANAGKSAALRRALADAKHGIIVFLDADTLFEPATIPRLIAPLRHPLMAAVSGHACVGNARNFVTRCQSLEYLCGFNLDRRAYTLWNCVTVVPGAISAFRRSAIEAAGGFSHDTLAEDTDMTLTLHRLRYRIGYAPDAIAWTEAPEKWTTLAKQRFRWAFGTMQCLWKHRDMTFNSRYRALGLFALPSVWFFHIILVAIVPFADAVLLWTIFTGYAASLVGYFAIFLAMDLFLATLACWLEREPLRRALLILPMRFVYRWLLAWVVWKSIGRALRGAIVGWGKLERTGTATAQT